MRHFATPAEAFLQVVVETNDPQDPCDDGFVEDSFEVIRPSTGRTETSDDFCADYLIVTGRDPHS